ncbi:MAG: hypothetical protein PWP57_1015 [Candidatus Atribacteria bacterium]|nr:hypothetical protein [Candidatus Atribacteria bacterium]
MGTDYLSPSATSPSYEHPLGSQLISSGQFTIYSPYPEEDFRFKGQLHCHTNASDGNNTPQEVVETYRSLGYDFVAITDHDLVTQDPEVPGILFIPGVEESSSSGHILGIGVQRQTDEMRPNKVIGHIQEQGGIAIYAHPNRLPLLGGWSLGGLLSNPGACSIEVLNRGTNSEDKWDSLLTRGYQVWGTVGDDYHMTNSIIKNTNRWVVVAAPDLREESIVAALQNGHFYSTEGPDLSVKVYPWGMTVSTSAEATIEWIARGGVKRKVTQGVKEDSYFIEGDERYVRAVVIRESDKKRALGQPVFIE